MNDKKFNPKSLITNEISLENLNDVFSDMRKQKILGKCIINLIQHLIYNSIESKSNFLWLKN